MPDFAPESIAGCAAFCLFVLFSVPPRTARLCGKVIYSRGKKMSNNQFSLTFAILGDCLCHYETIV
jgi:hypothetical protein